jgi:hypothetical protein
MSTVMSVMAIPVLTDRKIAFIREFVREKIAELSDIVYSVPDPVDPVDKHKEVLLTMIKECRRRTKLMSSYAVAMERFLDEAAGRTPSFIYNSFVDSVDGIYKSIEDLLIGYAWGSNPQIDSDQERQIDVEFNAFLFDLEEAYFTVKCAITRINLSFD